MTTPSITASQLEHLISVERFATFRHAEPDPDVAVALYTWNAQVAGHFAELLHHVEVLTRNAMHEQLTALHAQVPNRPAHKAWFDEPDWARHHWFDTHAGEEIAKATKRAGHGPSNLPPRESRSRPQLRVLAVPHRPPLRAELLDPRPRPRLQRPWTTYRPGQLSRYYSDFFVPHGRLYFGGSDLARGWAGFMDGAIESGAETAAALSRRLSEDS